MIEDRVMLGMLVLSTSKSTEFYVRFFRWLKQYAQPIQLRWTHVKLDFESGLIPAINLEFGNLVKEGCYFHFCTAVNRKMKSIGLSRYYDHNIDIKRFIKCLTALAFLPVHRVVGAFNELRGHFFPVQANDETTIKLNELLDYFEHTWLRNEQQISIEMWNVSHLDDHRTNNAVEGWHHKLKITMGIKPNLWKFIKCLKQLYAESLYDLQQINEGNRISYRKKRYTDVNEALRRLKYAYEAGQLNIENDIRYLQAICEYLAY
jgi:hypothetical protein